MTLSQASNTIVAYEGCPTAAGKAILKHVVPSGMQEKYANHNVDLTLWIYKKDEWKEAFLRYWMVESLITAEAEGKKAIRATYKAALKAINRNDDNCPILMEKTKLNILSQYMSMK